MTDFFKFCLVSFLQLVLFYGFIFILAKWRYQTQKAIKNHLNIRTQKLSQIAALIAVIAMAGVLALVYEVSTLVINKITVFTLAAAFAILYGSSKSALKKILPLLATHLKPNEKQQTTFEILNLALATILLSVSIALSFAFSDKSTEIQATVMTVKPARLGSPTNSVKVNVTVSGINKGVAFFRYNTQKTETQITEGSSLPFNLKNGSFGLNRLIPTAPHSFLKQGIINN